MRSKKFTVGITIFLTSDMFQELRRVTDQQNQAMSEYVRKALEVSLGKRGTEVKRVQKRRDKNDNQKSK